MAKAGLLNFMMGKFELGERLRFFKDQDLYAEMLSLRGKKTAAGNLTIDSQTTDDRFLACMYMSWGMLTDYGGTYVRVEAGESPYSYWAGEEESEED